MNRRRRNRSLCSWLIVSLLAGALSGCGSSSELAIDRRPFDVMPVRLESRRDQWEAVFSAPSGGWQARYDTDRPMFNGREIFITLTSPDPNAFVTQAVTDLHVLTPISTSVAIDVYARIAEFKIEGADPPGLREWIFGARDEGPPYFKAASESAAPPAP